MLFAETDLAGAYLIEIEPLVDERGFFARTFDEEEFRSHELSSCLIQASVSFNPIKGTLRGMHFQADPYPEAKLVRCTRGAIHDVIVDLRPESATNKHWVGVELSAENHKMLYVPEHFAHGFATLEDDTEVAYQMSERYSPGASRGVRWDDPAFSIDWPIGVAVISERDRAWPDYSLKAGLA